jgi:hypothetical protein
MAGTDTSSYGNIVKPNEPINPLQFLSGVAGLQNTLNQNKLFNQQYQTNIGLGQIYKSAINPNTGQLDTTKLNALISQNPNVTMALPQAIQNSQEAQGRQQTLQAQQLTLAKQHLDTLESYVAPLAANPNVTSRDIIGTMSQAMSMGHVDPSTASQLYASLPRDAQGNVNEAAVPGWLKQQQFRMMSMQQQFDAMNPAPAAVNTGAQTQFVRAPQVGQPSVVGSLQNTLPPTTEVFNPQTNQMQFIGGGGGGGRPAGAGAIGGSGGTGGGLGAAPPLGAESAANVDAQNAATQGINLQSRADRVPDNKAILGNLEGALNQFTSGPGSDWKKVAGAFINQNLQSMGGTGFNPKGIASQEEFNKQAGMLAQSQFQALGGTGTDAKLDATTLTSPNSALSKMGNQGIIAMLKGNEDAISAKNQAWQAYKAQNGPQSYGQFSTQFNKSYDPRVFQSQYLTPDDNKKMLSGMTKAEQKSFLNSYRVAIQNGWVKLPGSQ